MNLLTLQTWARRQWWAGASVVTLLSSAASAQTCPAPTLQVCQQPGYYQTECGKLNQKQCDSIFYKEWDAKYPTLPKRYSMLPAEFGAKPGYTGYTPRDVTKDVIKSLDSSVLGTILKSQLVYRKGLNNLSEADKWHYSKLLTWQQNGQQLTSCQEFVDEAYQGYSRFEARAGAHGTHFRAFFNAAYGKEGIAARKLYDSAGATLAPIWEQKPVEKNAYFLFSPGPYPDGFTPYAFDPKLVGQLKPEARAWYVPSDTWHQEMSKAVANYHDDELDLLQARQEEFAELVAQRQQTWDFYTAELKRQKDPKELGYQVAEELYSLDKAIEQYLYEANNAGCLTLQGVSKCDWAPRRYKQMLDTAMIPRREVEYQRCLFLTGNDFSEKSFVRNAELLGLPELKGDYTFSVAALREYLERYGSIIFGGGTPTDPATALVRLGGERSGGDSFGDGTFGAGYSYSAGWGVGDLASTGRLCDANARLYAQFTAEATVFSNNFEVVHARAEAATETSEVHVTGLLRVLGSDIYTHDARYPLHFNVTSNPSIGGPLFSVSAPFVVVVVPVIASAGATGTVGLQMGLSGGVSRDCTQDTLGVDILGTVTPYGRLEAFASVRVDIGIAAAGVRGTLTLVRADLPLTGELGIYLTSPSHPTYPSTVLLHVGSSLRFNITTLSGRIALFASLLGRDVGELELASWSGLTYRTTLYDESFETPLASLR